MFSKKVAVVSTYTCNTIFTLGTYTDFDHNYIQHGEACNAPSNQMLVTCTSINDGITLSYSTSPKSYQFYIMQQHFNFLGGMGLGGRGIQLGGDGMLLGYKSQLHELLYFRPVAI